MHDLEKGFGARFRQNPRRLAQGAFDLGADVKLALFRLPVPDIGTRACKGQGAPTGLAEEVARQVALAEGVMRQRRPQHDQHGAEPRQQQRRERFTCAAGQRGEGRDEGPEQDRGPGHHGGVALDLALAPQPEDHGKAPGRDQGKGNACQARGDQRFGQAIDRQREEQAADHGQDIAGHRKEPAKLGHRDEEQQQRRGHGALDQRPGHLEIDHRKPQRPERQRHMACLHHHEADAGEREGGGRKEHRACPEPVECRHRDGEQHGDAQQGAAEEGEIVLLLLEGLALPDGRHRQLVALDLEGDGGAASGVEAEGIGLAADDGQLGHFDGTGGGDCHDAAARSPRPSEAGADEALVGDDDHQIARLGAVVAQAGRHPAEDGARAKRIELHHVHGGRPAVGPLDLHRADVRFEAGEIGQEIDARRAEAHVERIHRKGAARGCQRQRKNHHAQPKQAGETEPCVAAPTHGRELTLRPLPWQGVFRAIP